MKFLVTALWDDCWDNIEEHFTLSAALDFARETLSCEGVISVKIEKVPNG